MERGKEIVAVGNQIAIPPGQLAILITEETIRIPSNRIGLISIKFSAKIRGLINVSGFHVDPGFDGKLKFSVYNAGSRDALFDVGQPLFTMWLNTLTHQEKDVYDGNHQGQAEISASDVSNVKGVIASPGALKELIDSEVTSIRRELWFYRIGAAVLMTTLIMPSIERLISQQRNGPESVQETKQERNPVASDVVSGSEGEPPRTDAPQ